MRTDDDSSNIVIHVGFGPLGDVVDLERIQAISPGAEIRTVHYDLSHDEHTRRSLEPRAPDRHDGEIELTAELRDALARADVMLTLNAPLDLPSFAPRLRWIQAMGSGVGQFVPSRLPDGEIVLITHLREGQRGAALGEAVRPVRANARLRTYSFAAVTFGA